MVGPFRWARLLIEELYYGGRGAVKLCFPAFGGGYCPTRPTCLTAALGGSVFSPSRSGEGVRLAVLCYHCSTPLRRFQAPDAPCFFPPYGGWLPLRISCLPCVVSGGRGVGR